MSFRMFGLRFEHDNWKTPTFVLPQEYYNVASNQFVIEIPEFQRDRVLSRKF